MVKSLKRAISLIVVAVFILSLVPVVSFAEIIIPEAYKLADSKPWTGNNVPNCSFFYAGTEYAVNQNTSSVVGKKNNASEMAYSDGTFGKLSGDMVYLLRDSATKTGAELNQHGSYFNVGLTAPAEVPVRTSDFAVEFSFALTDSTDKIQILTPMYTNYEKAKANGTSGATGYNFNLTYSNANFFGTSYKFDKELKLNEWYNAVVTYDVWEDSTGQTKQNSYNFKLYINSELYASHSIDTSLYGPRYVRLGTTSVGNSADLKPDNWVHYDNINSYTITSVDSFTPSKPIASTLSSSDSAIEFIENTIAAPSSYTVGDIKKSLSSSNAGDVIRYYNSDYSAIKGDSEPALNTNIVVVSKTGDVEETFSYYTVEKWMKKYPGINPGTQTFSRGGSLASGVTSSFWKVESIAEGIGGKASDDYYLSYADESGSYYQSIDVGNAAGNQDILEMSVYAPKDAKAVSLSMGIYDETSGYNTLPLLFKDDGIYTNFSTGASKFYSWEADKWYNVAIITPAPYTGAVNSDGESMDSNLVHIYVNGMLVDEREIVYSRAGFRHIRLSSSTPTVDDVSAYFDNIRVHSGYYEPQYDRLAEISYIGGIDKDNNIIIKSKTTVGQLKADIDKEEDTAIRVYSSLASSEILSDDVYVEDGYVVVAAAMNNTEMERSYNYYTVNKIPNEVKVTTMVNGLEARLYDADDTLSVSADFSNYTNNDVFTAKMYTAQYKYGELINVWETPSQTVAAGGEATFTCDFAGIEEKENTSIKVMVVNEDLEAYCTYKTMRYTNSDAKATLYLMGDSAVQTYVDVGYPIQGWGCYIGDYLNDNITVDNRGRSGWTTDHYLYPDGIYTKENGLYPVGTELLNTEGRKKVVGESDRYRCWDNIKTTLKAGDYIMIALAINDMGSGNVPVERYVENIETVYEEATSIGATVILLTPTIRGRDWNSTADFRQDYISRGKYFQEFAEKHNTICLPLGAELVKTYNAMVEEYQTENPAATLVEAKNYVRNYFHLYGASSTNPPAGWENFGTKTEDDDGHYNYVGVNKVASVIAKLLKESGSPLGDYVIIP